MIRMDKEMDDLGVKELRVRTQKQMAPKAKD